MASNSPEEHLFADREQFTVTVQCHWCGNNGMSLWKETNGKRQLVSLGGFYERLNRKEHFAIQTVCNTCGKAQPI